MSFKEQLEEKKTEVLSKEYLSDMIKESIRNEVGITEEEVSINNVNIEEAKYSGNFMVEFIDNILEDIGMESSQGVKQFLYDSAPNNIVDNPELLKSVALEAQYADDMQLEFAKNCDFNDLPEMLPKISTLSNDQIEYISEYEDLATKEYLVELMYKGGDIMKLPYQYLETLTMEDLKTLSTQSTEEVDDNFYDMGMAERIGYVSDILTNVE